MCSDELEALLAEQFGEGSVVRHIRKYIDDTYGAKDAAVETIRLDAFVRRRLEYLKPAFAHREVEVVDRLNPAPPILMPPEALAKIIDGLVKNAIENTPDEGRVEIDVKPKREGHAAGRCAISASGLRRKIRFASLRGFLPPGRPWTMPAKSRLTSMPAEKAPTCCA